MDAFLVSRVPAGATDAFVAGVEKHGSTFLGPQYKTTVRTIVSGGPVNTVITIARNAHSPLPEYLFEDESTIYVFSGYLVDEAAHTRTVKGWFGSPDRDERPVLRSPGGIYSYLTVRRRDGQVCAGHSTPTLEPVYWSETPEGLHVGNNPLLVHVASIGMEQPRMDESFYLSAMNAGVAIDGSTPFIGCYRLPPRSVLTSRPGSFGVRVSAAPRPTYGRFAIATLRQRQDAVSESLIRAGNVLKSLPRGDLRVSGGKDSRLLAAHLAHEGIAATPINQNYPGEVEGQIADRVAQVLGWESCVRAEREKPPQGDEIRRLSQRKIAFAGGLPSASSLQYTIQSEGSAPGIPLIMGHAHLQRGGLVPRIKSPQEAVTAASTRTVSPYLRPEYAERNARVMRGFVSETLAAKGATVQAIGFHAYLEYTLNFQLQSLYAFVRNWNPLVTPMVDERFALLCEDIAISAAPRFRGGKEHAGIIDLRNERIAMGVTGSLAPALLEFPLAGGRFRCDGPEWDHFDLRDPDSVQGVPVTRDQLSMVFNTRRTRPHVRAQLWEQIEGTVIRSWGELTCRPEIWRYISEPDTDVPEGESQVALNQFLWNLYGYSLIMGTDWWSQLADTPAA